MRFIHPVQQLFRLSSAMFVGLLATQVQAEKLTNLDTVTVTATREAEEVSKQALSIAKKSSEEVALDQVQFQKDLLNSIAGISIKQTSSVIGHMTAIRTPNTTLPYFLYLQDGVPVQSSGFFNHNGLAYTNFQTAQSIEVIKGAGTALYGSDSIAATINTQSAPPSKALERSVNISGGSDQYKQAGFSVSDTLENDQSYRLDFSTTANEGWRDHTDLNRYEISGQYNFSTDDSDFKISLSSNYSRAQQAGSLLSLDELENDPTSVGDIEDKLDLVDAIRQFDHNRLSVQWDSYAVEDIDLSTIAYIRNTRNQYTATWEGNLPHNDSEQNTLGIMHKGTMNPTWGRFIYGVDGEVTQGSRTYTQQFDYVPTGWGSSVDAGTIYDYEVDYLAVSPYVHADWKLANNLTLSSGLRYDINQYQYTNNTEDGEYGSSGYLRVGDRNDRYEHLSPKLALNYALTDNSMVYARYANSFRVPSANRLYAIKTSNAESTLDPETSNTYEVGYKFKGSSTAVEVALYYMDISDTITSYEDPVTGLKYNDNGGSTINKGVELSVHQTLTPEWSTKLAYSRSEHRFDNDPEYGNNEMASAPNNNLNLRLFYRPSQVSGLLMMAEVQHLSDYYMDHAHTFSYDGYTSYNLKADYKINKQWQAFAKVNNVTDERYAESASFSWGKEKYTPAAPRQVFLGVKATW
ncbi:MAG: TonB-dependent receptor [Thiomicrorhabdus sp.]|nr:TonB-dependent receptor [Thiomicrorhabdus sp.]